MSFGFIDFAKDVLKASDSPLSVEEMWEAGCNLGLDENRDLPARPQFGLCQPESTWILKIIQIRYLYKLAKGQLNFS